MDEKTKSEEVKALVMTRGWKILIKEFLKKKESLKSLLMDTDLDTKEGLDNGRKYQAMFNAIEAFEENTRDIIEISKEEEVK